MREPKYMQLADMIAKTILDGTLAPGSKMPTHRAFAEKFDIAVATATRIYKELERRGVVIGEAGRGTFVRDTGVPPTLGVHQTEQSDQIDLVFNMPGGAGDSDLLRHGLRRLAASGDLEALLRYQPHSGRPHERRIIADHLTPTLGAINPDRLLITSGGQHGLAITALGLLQQGDVVATDALTYPGFKSVAVMHRLDLVPIKGMHGVMDPDDLDKRCRSRKIRAVYLMPTVQNPLGSVMDMQTRDRIVDVARKHNLMIIEDAAYAFLEPDPPPTLIQLAPERTVYIGGFSKSLATGLRLGYVVAPDENVEKLIEATRATTWNAPALISSLVTGWIKDGTLEKSENRRRIDGAKRQEVCQIALDGLPIIAHPNAGFAWLPLQEGSRASPVVARLKAKGISISGAEAFATTTAIPQALRLAFGGLAPTELESSIKAVRDAVRA
ncbi:PLP-dependent aminotransferase family protein [Sulfitobacter sp. CW3]|uniref:aminotransferase-like domain-containing protein n=1 Tax=Sulfitobacter sp. CW3 TaxID=2861965 RepID=UPI001C5FFA96|nr:PLP-dependent aminotransferase family protein [Sulfitobacter sp. CW3]MBW4960650.1 PLP-dependent aminotransferase family protein [Sulfitobacter sp. CW3]